MGIFNKRIKFINELLGSQNFYPFLCAFSNNDVKETISNLAKLIDYILTTEEEVTSLDIDTLLKRAKASTKEGKFLIYGTNSYLDNIIKLTGLNPAMENRGINRELTMFYQSVTFLDKRYFDYFPLYGSVKEAIEQGFTHPKSLYKGILKQPETDKRPAIVGETETQYYSSILQTRLHNAPLDYQKTGAIKAKRILKEMIGRDITLYFISPDKYVKTDNLTTRVSPFELTSIKIPSYYNLLMTCASNKKLKEGTKLNIDTGEEYRRKEVIPKVYSSLSYKRYEMISINNDFNYSNEELTGDLSYDLDYLYGSHDPKDNRSLVRETNLDDRIKMIKHKYDINLTYRNGMYDIGNGRHRILFLKHYYQTNYRDCILPIQKRYLDNQTTIVANVDYTFEDEEINRYLIFFEERFKQVYYYKNNCNNDEFDIIVICGNHAYHIPSKEDLFRFVKLMRKEEYKNQYLVGLNSNYEVVPYEELIFKLEKLIGPTIYRMNLMDIVNYLKNHKIEIHGEEIEFASINYERLYVNFNIFIQMDRLNRIIMKMSRPPIEDDNLEEFYSSRMRKK